MFSPEKHQDEVNRLMKIGHYADAISLLEELITFFSEAQDWEKHAVNLNRCSECFWRLGNYKKSVSIAEQALLICNTHLDEGHIEVANSFNHLGICYSDFGDYDLGIQYHQQSLAIKQIIYGDNHPITANSYNNLGLCFRKKGDYAKAMSYHYHALNIREKVFGKEHLSTARSYHNIGVCLHDKEDFKQALRFKHLSLNIKVKELGEYHPDTAITYHGLGVSYQLTQKYAQAIEVYKKALDLKIKTFGDQHPHTALTYYNIGYCYQQLGLHDQAFNHFQQALTIWMNTFGILNSNTAMCYRNIAQHYFHLNNYPESLHFLQKSMQSLALSVPDTDFYARPKLTGYISATQLLETLSEKATVFLSQYKQTHLLKDLTASLAYFLCADELVDQMRQSYKVEDSTLTLAEKAKRIVYDAGLEALQIAELHCKSMGQEMFTAEMEAYKEEYGYNLPDALIDLAFHFSEKSKGILLYAGIKDAKARADMQLSLELEAEERQLRLELSFLEQCMIEETNKEVKHQNADTLSEWQTRHFHSKKQYDALIERLEKDFPHYYRLKYDLKITTIGQIQSALSPKTAVISYVLTEGFLYTFIITPTNQHWEQQKLPAGFEHLTGDFTYTFHPFEKEIYLQYGYELYRLLLQPLEEKGLLNHISHLVIIPDGSLSHIPFEALLTQACSGKQPFRALPYLLHHYVISYHYSATLWFQQQTLLQATEQNQELTHKIELKKDDLMGDFIGFAPVYSDAITSSDENDIDLTLEVDIYEKLGLENPQNRQRIHYAEAEGVLRSKVEGKDYVELLNSENEVREAGQMFAEMGQKARVLLHQSATLEAFKTLAGQYKYVLIAAHTDVDDQQPERTGIIFSPNEADGRGIFYMSDAYNLNLQAEVVVLSCCETGLGKVKKGEGTLALNRGFLYSGAKNVVYTLFKVYDKESSQLTTHLFSHLLAKQSCAEALHNAKLLLIQQGLMPIKWAGYVMVGE